MTQGNRLKILFVASKQEDADPHRDEQSVRARRLRTTPRYRRPLMEESKGTFKHSAKYDAMKAKYGAGGERRERPSRRESPAAPIRPRLCFLAAPPETCLPRTRTLLWCC